MTLQSDQKHRVERDTFGELQVPADRYWGAQTQRYAIAFQKIRASVLMSWA